MKYETTLKLKNRKTIIIRPVKSTDERLFQELHYSLEMKDRYFRFFTPVHDFRHNQIQPMVNIDYSTDMILVAEYSENSDKRIIAVGGFFKTGNPSVCEIAFVTHEGWRGLGISRFLLSYLIQIARELKYKAFTGSILLENKAMLSIIDKAGYPMTFKHIEAGTLDFVMDISKGFNA